MLGTARVYVADTLNARVNVLRQVGDRYEVEVITGVGGWSTPGKKFWPRTDIVAFDAAAPEPVVEEPTPLAKPISGAEYIDVLLQRRAAWMSAKRPFKPKFPPPVEYFMRAEDEQFVQVPEAEPQPKRQRTPRVYRSAASLREARDKVAAKLAAFNTNDVPDRAAANLSPNAKSKAARRAGQRRFAKMDRDLQRYVELQRKLTTLDFRVKAAEAREAKADAARASREAQPDEGKP